VLTRRPAREILTLCRPGRQPILAVQECLCGKAVDGQILINRVVRAVIEAVAMIGDQDLRRQTLRWRSPFGASIDISPVC